MATDRALTPKRVLSFSPITIVNPTLADYSAQAMVTFSYDDGLTNQIDRALPLHEKYNIPCTFNVIAGRLYGLAGFMTALQVKDCARRGVEIASHSYFHDAEFPTKNDSALIYEAAQSKHTLNKAVGHIAPVETFAVPFSAYDGRVKGILQQYYKSIRVFSNLQNTIPPVDRHWLYSAIAVGNTATFTQIKAKIDQAVTNKQWCLIMLHGVQPVGTTLNTYEITDALLEQILSYVASFPRSTLLPVNTRDAMKFMLGGSY